ncbi:DUF4190 domain-containing protein [Agromyces sp. PvR057]|uniref:DUF4190 domain-containing protein n=1 Tax=Agromyces sp. PvR057 TaxID=3156403 RepID=UPI003390ACB5
MTLHRDAAWAAVNDPITDAGTLAEVAHAYPEFGVVIERHPNSYDGLNEWLRTTRSVVNPVTASVLESPSVAPAPPAVAAAGRSEVPYRGRAAGAVLWAIALACWMASVAVPLALMYQNWSTILATQGWLAAASFGFATAGAIASASTTARRVGSAVILLVALASVLAVIVFGGGYFGRYLALSGAVLLFCAWAISRPIRGAGWAAIAFTVVGGFGVDVTLLGLLLGLGLVVLSVVLARVWSNGSVRRRWRASGPSPAGASASAGATNPLAIAAFICAFFFGIPAVVLGHVALTRITRTGEGGRGLAVAALVLGYLGIAAALILVVTSFSSLLAAASYGGVGY